MAMWDTADLLARAKRLARRPATDQAVPDTSWYAWLTEAQQAVYTDLFSRFPDFAYSAPVLLTTADGGLTYTFGLDASGDAIRPTGSAELYPTLNSIPDSPMQPGTDFIFEGGKIRFPGGRTRTFTGGPYARFVADPDVAIAAGVNPQLQPKAARMLLVYKALEQYASRPGSGADPRQWEDRYNKELTRLFLRFSTNFNRQGAQAAGANQDAVWYYSGDLGQSGLNS